MQVRRLRVVPKIDTLASVTDDVLSAGVLRVSASDKLLHLVDVEWRHDFREGQVLSDGAGNTDLQRLFNFLDISKSYIKCNMKIVVPCNKCRFKKCNFLALDSF